MQSFLVFRRTKIGMVYLAQNILQGEGAIRNCKRWGGGFFLWLYFVIYLFCRYFSLFSCFHFSIFKLSFTVAVLLAILKQVFYHDFEISFKLAFY